jgi:hypothetical protein
MSLFTLLIFDTKSVSHFMEALHFCPLHAWYIDLAAYFFPDNSICELHFIYTSIYM